MSRRTSDKNGYVVASGVNGEGTPAELDPMGNNAGAENPYPDELTLPTFDPDPSYPMLHPFIDDAPMYVNGQQVSCTLDGMSIGCGRAMGMLNNGSAAQCPNNNCGPIRGTYNGQTTWAFFNAYADGYSGYVPANATYTGNGNFRPSGYGFSPPGFRSPNMPRDTNWAALNGVGGSDERYLSNFGSLFSSDVQGNVTYLNFHGLEAARAGVEKLMRTIRGCGEMLNALLNQLKPDSHSVVNSIRASDMLSLFDNLNAQTSGGIRVNSSDAAFLTHTGLKSVSVAGGGGLTIGFPTDGKHYANGTDNYVHAFSYSYANGPVSVTQRTVSAAEMAQRISSTIGINLLRVVHEMYHGAGRNGIFSHEAMNKAAKIVDPTAKSADDFVRKHCTSKIQ